MIDIRRTVCIYHSPCVDGFTAAWVVNRAYPFAEFVQGVYGEAPPDVTDCNVILVDFSYKRPVMEKMLESCNSMLILDHHKSAEADLAGLSDTHSNLRVIFDNNRSGAVIAFHYFFPALAKLPPALLAVQARDLWCFDNPDTEPVSEVLFSYEQSFENWDELMDEERYPGLVREGKSLMRKKKRDIEGILKATRRMMRIGGIEVPCANVPYTLGSDAGNIMAGEIVGTNDDGDQIAWPFAATYFDGPGGRKFSIRSTAGNPAALDVSKIAEQYGGGGHTNAAGFLRPLGWEGDPIPMKLRCPKCDTAHIDQNEWATRPHKTHLCSSCGHEWRPANVATVGVAELHAGV